MVVRLGDWSGRGYVLKTFFSSNNAGLDYVILFSKILVKNISSRSKHK